MTVVCTAGTEYKYHSWHPSKYSSLIQSTKHFIIVLLWHFCPTLRISNPSCAMSLLHSLMASCSVCTHSVSGLANTFSEFLPENIIKCKSEYPSLPKMLQLIFSVLWQGQTSITLSKKILLALCPTYHFWLSPYCSSFTFLQIK